MLSSIHWWYGRGGKIWQHTLQAPDRYSKLDGYSESFTWFWSLVFKSCKQLKSHFRDIPNKKNSEAYKNPQIVHLIVQYVLLCSLLQRALQIKTTACNWQILTTYMMLQEQNLVMGSLEGGSAGRLAAHLQLWSASRYETVQYLQYIHASPGFFLKGIAICI